MPDAEESYVQAFDDKFSECSINFSMNISNTTNVYHITHACVKFVKTQFFCPKELHVYFHLISPPHPAFTSSKLTTETLEQGVEYVQS